MNTIRNVFKAFSNLAASVNALAGVIDVATGRLRQQLALDSDTVPGLPYGDNSGAEADSTTTNGKKRAKANA